jgi:hypothetical protein
VDSKQIKNFHWREKRCFKKQKQRLLIRKKTLEIYIFSVWLAYKMWNIYIYIFKTIEITKPNKNGQKSFSIEDMLMVSNHMKRYSTSFDIRQWKIKTVIRHNSLPIRLVKIQTVMKITGCTGVRETPNVRSLWRITWYSPTKLNVMVPDSLPCYLPR